MIDVVWRAYNPDAYPGSMKPQTTLLLPWAGIADNAEKVAEEVCELYFRGDDEWVYWFGDDTSVDLMVEITEPPEIAGRFSVEIERVLKARASRTTGQLL